MDDLIQSARTRLANALLGTPDEAPAAPASPFQWGSNGARLTPDQIASRQKVADAMVAQGTSAAPLPEGTRGAGVWTQGLARVAHALMGGLEERDLQQQTAANNKADADLLLSNPALQGAAPAATSATTPVVAADASVPRGIRNNNPLNIEDGDFAKAQPGYVGTDGRFAKFATPDHGTAAANSLLDTYQNKYGLNTVGGIVNRWAPASDGNNVNAYASDVSSRMGVDPNAPLTAAQRPALIAAMGQHENGQPIQVASAAPTSGVSRVAAALAATPSGTPAASAPSGAPAASGAPQIPPATASYIRTLIQNPGTRAAGVALLAQYQKPKETYSQQTDADGNVWNINQTTGQRTVALQADKDPTSVKEYNFYKTNLPAGQEPMPYDQWSTAKARAGATTVNNNFDPNAGQTYDKQLAEGLAKSHAGLANGVEDAQARARAYATMQGAIDAIQKNGGTTGGMAPEQILAAKKTANSAAAALGMNAPFDENNISDAEMLQKSGRQLAGEMAKNAVGSRVTNFEMQNYLAANPGLALSPTGNQRLIGIGSQIEQRNIAVGNAIREATAQAVSQGKRIDPVTVQHIISEYDAAHHVTDPVTGQDLTQSYVLPEFQTQGTNASLAVGHETNIGNIRIRRIQ